MLYNTKYLKNFTSIKYICKTFYISIFSCKNAKDIEVLKIIKRKNQKLKYKYKNFEYYHA